MDRTIEFLDTVEKGITFCGVDAALCRTEAEGQWNMKTEKQEIWVDLWYVEQEGRTYFQVMSPMFTIPELNTEHFYRELLDINYQLIGSTFVTYQNGIYLKQIMEADFLTAEEVALALQRMGFYGERFSDKIRDRYNVQKIEHHEQ